MRQPHPNLGTLERWWAIRVAELKAVVYTMFHWTTRASVEYSLVEKRGRECTSEYLFIDEAREPAFEQRQTFIGVVRGSYLDDTLKIVRTYYGRSRYDNND